MPPQHWDQCPGLTGPSARGGPILSSSAPPACKSRPGALRGLLGRGAAGLGCSMAPPTPGRPGRCPPPPPRLWAPHRAGPHGGRPGTGGRCPWGGPTCLCHPPGSRLLKTGVGARPGHLPSFPAPGRCRSPRAGREAPAASQRPAARIPRPGEGPRAPGVRWPRPSWGERDPLPGRRGFGTWLGWGEAGGSQPDPSQIRPRLPGAGSRGRGGSVTFPVPSKWLLALSRRVAALPVAAVPCPALAVAGRCFPNAGASLAASGVVLAAEGSVDGRGRTSPPDPRALGGSETGTSKIFPRAASPGPAPLASHGHHRGRGTMQGRGRCPWLGGPGGLPPARWEAAPSSGTGCPGSTARPGAAGGGGPQKGTERRGEGAPRGAVAAGGVNSPPARPSLYRGAGAGARGPWP